MFELYCFGSRNGFEQTSGPNYGLTSLYPSSHEARVPEPLPSWELSNVFKAIAVSKFFLFPPGSKHTTGICLLSHHGGLGLKCPPKAPVMEAPMCDLSLVLR